MKSKKSTTQEQTRIPLFVTRAERALRRAARNVRAENRARGLPIIVWENGKVVKKPA